MKINLKCDDLTLPWNEKWQRFFDCCSALNVPVSCGLIGSRVQPNIEVNITGEIEIWNHGFDHLMDDSGVCDFYGSSLAKQVSGIEKTQTIIEQYFGERASCFGAPYNFYDYNLLHALKNFDEIEYVYHVPFVSQKRSLSRRMFVETEFAREGRVFNLEHSMKASEVFINNKQPFILQVHPGNGWEETCLENFSAFVQKARSKGYEFTDTRSWVDIQQNAVATIANFIVDHQQISREENDSRIICHVVVGV